MHLANRTETNRTDPGLMYITIHAKQPVSPDHIASPLLNCLNFPTHLNYYDYMCIYKYININQHYWTEGLEAEALRMQSTH